MSLAKAMQKLKLDKRLIEQNLTNGNLSKEEYAQYLASLPDLANQVAPMDLEDASDDIEDEDLH